MLIIKITANGKETYHGCAEVSVDMLDDKGGRRIKMKSTAGLKRIKDITCRDGAEILNDVVFL